jgi:hypothetical protein
MSGQNPGERRTAGKSDPNTAELAAGRPLYFHYEPREIKLAYRIRSRALAHAGVQ